MSEAKKRGRPIRGKTVATPISVRFDADDHAAVSGLATIWGVSKAVAVSMAIKAAWADVTPAQRRALAALLKAREEAK